MKKVLIIFFAFCVILAAFFLLIPKKQKHEPLIEKKSIIKKEVKEKNTIFVPYWTDITDTKDLNNYNRIIYFGVEANQYGIQNSESRIQNWKEVIKSIPKNKEKWLTVVMTNTDNNLEILEDSESWSKIAGQSIKVAQENGFSGLVMDLEVSALALGQLPNQIVEFNKFFYQKTQAVGLSYAVLIYGDNFYRARPYFMPEIKKYADEIMVMAYDFHKSRGEPGPNFPFKDSNGYDFQSMISDFLASIPPDRLTIVFGMFGYDWSVDEQKRPITQAKSLTLNEIKKKFIDKCEWKDCIVRRDKDAGEAEVNYINSVVRDNIGYMDMHVVWFEDEESVKLKQNYLLEKGIGSVGYWAWGYF